MSVYTLRILQVIGIWPSNSWPSPCQFIYKCLTYFNLLLLFSLFIGQLFYIIIKANNVSDIFASCPVFILTIEVVIKLHTILTKKNEIKDIITKLSIVQLELKDDVEEKIYKQYRAYLKIVCLCFAIFYASGGGIPILTSILKNTYSDKVWIPHWIDINVPHWILHMYFRIPTLFGILVLLISRTIYVSILIRTSMHLDILHHRFSIVPTEDKKKADEYLVDCIRHHLSLFELAANIQNTFFAQVTSEICAFGTKLCVSVLVLTSVNLTGIRAFVTFNYVVATLGVNFLHFWEANKVTLKSIAIGDSLYQMDWFCTQKSTTRIIQTIMHRSMMRPIIFTGILSIPMSNDTFTCILNASYQAFCVLRTVMTKSVMNY